MIKETYWKIGDKAGNKEKAVSEAVKKALQEFCKQDPEFERAIEESGKTFLQCLEAAMVGVRNSISDLEVYQRAVRFYFDGAKVKFKMEIDLIGDAKVDEKPIEVTKNDKLSFSLDDLI